MPVQVTKTEGVASALSRSRKLPGVVSTMNITKSKDPSGGGIYTRMAVFMHMTERWREYRDPSGNVLLRIHFSMSGRHAKVAAGSFEAVRKFNPDMMPQATEDDIRARLTWLPFNHMARVPTGAEDEALLTALIDLVDRHGIGILDANEQRFLRENAHRLLSVKVE